MAQEPIANDTLLEEFEQDSTPLPEGYDEDADAYAAPPPLPDAEYMAELSLSGVKSEDGEFVEMTEVKWANDQQAYPWLPVRAKILDPGGKQDGKFANDSTLRSRPDKNGANPVDAVYKAITGKANPGVSLKSKAAYLIRELRGKPIVKVVTQLEGEPMDATKAFKERKKAGALEAGEKAPKKYKGQAMFTVDGKLQGSVIDPGTGEPVVARAQIKRYLRNG